MRYLFSNLAVVLCLLMLGTMTLAQDVRGVEAVDSQVDSNEVPVESVEPSRVLRLIDFEERRLGNPEDLPMHWLKLEGSNLPHYVNGKLTRDTARNGEFSFRFDLNGGSLLYRYDPKRVPVREGAHYRVETWVKTTPLPHARARLTAYFVDQDLRPLFDTIVHSAVYAATGPSDNWQRLSVELSTEPSSDKSGKAATGADSVKRDVAVRPTYLVVELGLLQPNQYAPSTLGQRTLFAQDIRGTCWWDDLSVSQVPKVMLSTDRPGNIFRRGEAVNLRVRVNDRVTDDLAGQLVIRDARGEVVYQRSGAQDISSTESNSNDEKHAILSVPPLRPGWYTASLAMTSRGVLVGEQSLDLIQLADDGPISGLPGSAPGTDPINGSSGSTGLTSRARVKGYFPDRRFGVIATDLPFEGWDELPDVLPFLSVGRVKLAVWSRHGDVQGYDAVHFDHLLERLGELGITPTACLVDLPPRIAEEISALRQSQSLTQGLVSRPDVVEDAASRWVKLLDAPPDIWRPQLAYLISRHAQHLDRWQLGADGTEAFVTNPQMRDVYGLVYKEFEGLMNRPDLAMPWPGWYELDGQLPATVALSVPSSVLPSQLPLYIQDLNTGATSATQSPAKSSPQLSINLELLDAQQYGRETQIRDFAQRVVYALAGGATRIDLPLPFTVKKVGDAVVKQPQELLLIMRTLITTLGHAQFKGKVPIAENVEAFLFDKNGQGILVLWSRGNDPAPKKLPLNLGQAPMRVDLWGNVTPLVRGALADASATGVSTIQPALDVSLDIGPMPTFLIDIDGPAAQLRAGVGFDRPLIESSFQPHRRNFRFTNPY